RHWLFLGMASFGLTLVLNPGAASAAPQVFEASGATPADILTQVNAFRSFLGNPNNIAGPPSATGHREINWGGLPEAFAPPPPLPANFFNKNSPRGIVFFPPGTGFEVSANLVNPTNTPVRFGNIHPVYPAPFTRSI